MESNFLKSVRKSIKYWYLPLIIGILFILTGFYTFVAPQDSYLALAIIFSASFLASGILEIIFAVSNRDELDHWGWNLFAGIVTAIIGFLLLVNPQVTMITLPLYVGFTILIASFTAVGAAMNLKNYGVLDWGNLMVIGVLGILFSFFLIFNPLFAGMTIVVWTGLAFLAIGGFYVYVSIRLKKLKNNLTE
ncbi:DUF308 domain-containing protein [Tenacibaculum tangerinum]|uniref:DUF308 domain-containing protein n=1 Tax=Tenacibaculum tangerinum TaxID=3038772 RepID=A0ABY8L4I5_9FLAO|nr:DUF308 domain-containing protein [Tenacibaculum tangerinum]WGH75045.1 DUF308 domain-containing protein [Tenacibaculum tangerinum]